MESNPPKIGKFSLNYGLILGGISVIFGIMLFMADAHTSQSPINSVVSISLMVGVILWGISSFKKANDGYLSVGEALKLGAGIALVAGIIGVIYALLLANVLDPDFASKTMDSRLAEANLTPEQLQQQKEMSLKFWWLGYPIMLIFSIIIGLVIGLVGGLIFKKAKPEY